MEGPAHNEAEAEALIDAEAGFHRLSQNTDAKTDAVIFRLTQVVRFRRCAAEANTRFEIWLPEGHSLTGRYTGLTMATALVCSVEVPVMHSGSTKADPR